MEDTANGLIGEDNALGAVGQPIVSLAQEVLGNPLLAAVLCLLGLRIDSSTPATTTLTALNLDLHPIRALIDKPVASADGSVSVVLSEGLVSINTDALLSAAYSDEDADDPYPYGLNQLPPNTEPLKDSQVLSTLTDRLGSLLTGIVNDVNTALLAALDNAETNIELSIPVETQQCTLLLFCDPWKKSAISIGVSGSLTELLQDEADINIDLSAIPLAGNILTTLLSLLQDALLGTVGSLVGSAIDGILRPLATLPSNLLTTTVNPILTLVSTLYTNLFLSDVVSLMFNAQNDPRSGSPEPQDWVTTESRGIPPSQYDVAAIRLGVLDAARSAAVWLYLGRGSVGPVCTPADVAAGGCAGY